MSSNQSTHTVQVVAGSLKKNNFVMIKNHPCKVITMAKFKVRRVLPVTYASS